MAKFFRPKKDPEQQRQKFDKVIERFGDKATTAWSVLQVSQVVRKVEPLDPSCPKPPNHTRFVCISDTHNFTNFKHTIPDGDVLIHAGDFTMVGTMKEIRDFNDFFTSQSHPYKVVIAGNINGNYLSPSSENHDIAFDEENYESLYPYWRNSVGEKVDVKEAKRLLDPNKCIYLEDSEVTINGIRIYGSPWVPEFGRWAFMLPRGPEIKEKWDKIPEGIDVLITHGPPLGYGDTAFTKLRAGCIHLLDAVQHRVKPKYHVYGHIHEGYGMLTNDVTTFVNASIATVRYRPENKPIVFDLPNK